MLRAGKWNKHVDAWDAVKNNEFFSPEAWIFAFGQMFQACSWDWHACKPLGDRGAAASSASAVKPGLWLPWP